MSGARVVPITERPRKRRVHAPEEEAIGRRVAELERELARARSAREHEGLLVNLARVVQSGARGVTWASLARLQRALYFSWHSEQTDAFGADSLFSETLEPLLQFLYAVWWRVEASGLEHLPSAGPGLVVANHSGTIALDSLMTQVAVHDETPGHRNLRLRGSGSPHRFHLLSPGRQLLPRAMLHQSDRPRVHRPWRLLRRFPTSVDTVDRASDGCVEAKA